MLFHPANKLIRTKILLGETIEQINDTLEQFHLHRISDEDGTQYVAEVRYGETISSEISAYLADRKSNPVPRGFSAYARMVGAETSITSDVASILRLLENDSGLLKDIYALTMLNTSINESSSLLLGKYGARAEINDDLVVVVRQWLFDTRTMTRSEWKALYNGCSEDFRVMAATVLQNKPNDAKILLGLNSRVSFTELLQEVMVNAAVKFRKYAGDNNTKSDAQARAWANTLMAAGVHHEKFGSKDVGDFAKSVQMEFAFTDTSFASADELDT